MSTPPSDRRSPTGVVVPIRSFVGAKSRLDGVLDPAEREELVRRLAARVMRAAGDLATWVVSDDPDVAAWAGERGVGALPVRCSGLSESVQAAVSILADQGLERVVVAHADLARVVDLSRLLGPGLVIAPDRRGDGSNAMCVPTDAGYRFEYGPGSFARHAAQARRLGLAVTVVDDPTLAWDVDEPADLAGVEPADDPRLLEQP